MNRVDTLTPARQDRENQGPWEAEYSYGEEADLYRHYVSCKKNPGHTNFIPVDKFSIDDLPEDYRHNDMVDYIRAVSDLTVRVSVKYVSDRRPPTVPGSRQPYPGYSDRGRPRMTVGTGLVDSVSLYPTSSGKTCSCTDCQNSSAPKANYAVISIITAAHIVFDTTEGEHTTCHLFYDRGSTPETCSGVVTLTGMSNIQTQLTNDWCDMLHVTHDLVLAHRLEEIVKLFSEQRDKIFSNTLKFRRIKQRRDAQDEQPLLVILSHPHGCSKQISLGHWRRMEVDKEDNTICHLYTTPTCPGSSGALVCMPQAFTSPHVDVAFFTFRAVHCGAANLKSTHPGINYCQADPVPDSIVKQTHSQESGQDIQMLQMLSLETPQKDTGTTEGTFCCVKDEDENQDVAASKKNQGHRNFLPDEKVSLDDITLARCRNDVMEVIKSMSEQTVHVSIKYVSEERPETVTGTDIPYPWLKNSGSSMTRVGTGWIQNIKVYHNVVCNCKECENSKTPAQSFAHLSIHTSTHVVYDDPEITRHLFLDVTESPCVYTDYVLLIDMCDEYHDNEKPTHWLKYSTHNLELASRLQNRTRKQNHYIISMARNEEARYRSGVEHNGGENNKYQSPLNIVVTRPGGSSKEVRISCYGNTGDAKVQGKLYPCTLINVLGFSEARAIVLRMESTHLGHE